MKKYTGIIFILIIACDPANTLHPPTADSTIVINNDTIPETRKTVNREPIASYSERLGGENLNDWKLAVQVYETKRTFHFLVSIQYKVLNVSDSMNIPNFGIQPKIEVRKGKEPLSCILGFLDKKGQFKEYKLISTKNDRLRISLINNYYVGAYRTRQ